MKSTFLNTSLAILTLGAMSLAGSAQAGWRHDHSFSHDHAFHSSQVFSQQFHARQERQMARIRAGFHDGVLARHEARILMREQNAIRDMERRFGADGRIDAHEYARLGHAQDIAGHRIRAEKHDRHAHNRDDDHTAYGYDHRLWYN